jgi:hypothetical protein
MPDIQKDLDTAQSSVEPEAAASFEINQQSVATASLGALLLLTAANGKLTSTILLLTGAGLVHYASPDNSMRKDFKTVSSLASGLSDTIRTNFAKVDFDALKIRGTALVDSAKNIGKTNTQAEAAPEVSAVDSSAFISYVVDSDSSPESATKADPVIAPKPVRLIDNDNDKVAV